MSAARVWRQNTTQHCTGFRFRRLFPNKRIHNCDCQICTMQLSSDWLFRCSIVRSLTTAVLKNTCSGQVCHTSNALPSIESRHRKTAQTTRTFSQFVSTATQSNRFHVDTHPKALAKEFRVTSRAAVSICVQMKSYGRLIHGPSTAI